MNSKESSSDQKTPFPISPKSKETTTPFSSCPFPRMPKCEAHAYILKRFYTPHTESLDAGRVLAAAISLVSFLRSVLAPEMISQYLDAIFFEEQTAYERVLVHAFDHTETPIPEHLKAFASIDTFWIPFLNITGILLEDTDPAAEEPGWKISELKSLLQGIRFVQSRL